MMRPRIPVWQRRLMRPEFNGSQAGGPWTPGGTNSAPRAPGPRGLLNAPLRAPLHAQTPYDRPGPRGPAPSRVKMDAIPETQKQVLEMIDLAKKQLEIEREKILKQFQNKPDNGPLPSGPGGSGGAGRPVGPGRLGGPGALGGPGGTGGLRDMPGLLGERPDVPVGIGMQRGGSVNEKPGLLGQRPDQKFPGPGMNPGDAGTRMNGVRPPMNGPQPLMSLRGLGNMENPRGPMAGSHGPGFGPLGPNPGPRGPVGGANSKAGPRGAMSQAGLMGGPRQMGPMQGSRQMGTGQMDGQALGGPGAVGPRGLNGPGPRPGGGGMMGPQGSGMARPQRPGLGGVSGPQGPGIGGMMRPPRPGMGGFLGPLGPVGGMSRPQGPGMGGMSGALGPGGGMSRQQGPGMGGMSGPRGPGLRDSLLSRPQAGGLDGGADWRSRRDPLSEPGGYSSWQHDRSRLDPLPGADPLQARPGDRDYDYDLNQHDRVREERIEDRRFQPLDPVNPLYPPQRAMYGDRGRDFF